jgi:L-lactate dehydrogenase complex protein LldF
VKIDLHHQLLTWRRELAHQGLLSRSKRLGMQAMSFVFRRPALYRLAGRAARWLTPLLPRFMIYNGLNAWGKQRELPEFPAKSFSEQYAERRRHESERNS